MESWRDICGDHKPHKKKLDAVSNIQCPSTDNEGIEGELITKRDFACILGVAR